jgi:flagellar hook-length control protein FliK
VTDASTTPSLPPAVTAPQSEKAAPVTLQNDAAPANNTGRTASSGDTTVPTTAPAGETGDGQPATVAASKTAVFSSENTTQTALISRSSRQKETDKAKEADPSLSSAPQAGPSGTDGAVTDGTVAATLIAPSTDVSTSSSTLTGITQKPLTGAERAQIVRQLADGVATVKPQVLTNGQGQMTLDLHPKEWGDLRVTIKLAQGQTAEGVSQTVVTAHVVASSPVVKAALETHTAELNRALHETGLRLDRLTVTVQDASAGSQSGGSGTGGGGSSQQSSDRWQTSQPQAGSESSGIGGGGSSSFAAFSERHGGDTPQNRVTTRSAYASADGSDTSVPSLPDRSPRISAGFDQRA